MAISGAGEPQAPEPVEQAPQQPQEPPAQPQAPPDPEWIERLRDDFGKRFDAVVQEQQNQRTAIEEALAEPGEYDEYDDDYYRGDRDDLRPYPQFPPPQDANDLRQQMQEVVREELAPLHEQHAEGLWDQFFESNPDLLEDEEAMEYYANAIDQVAESAGRPELANDPRFATQIYEMMTGGREQGEAPEEGEPEVPETEGGNELFERLWQREQETPVRGFMEQLAPQITQEVQNQLAPYREDAREQAFKDLLEEFPYIGTEDGSKVVAEHVQYAADQYARRLGNPAMRELARDPSFVRQVWLAMNGESRAAPEGGAGTEGVAQVEGPGGSPGEPEPDHPLVQLWGKKRQQTLDWSTQ